MTLRTALPPAAALDAAEQTLRRRRWRVARVEAPSAGVPQVAAQRAHSRDAGSLVFHSVLPVALAAALAGQVLGFTGQVDVVEGEAFADTAVGYDRARPGRWWSPADHRGFIVQLDRFATSEHPTGIPAEFVATVTATPPHGAARTTDVELNAPLRVDGMRVHLARHGRAARLHVRDAAGEAVFDGPVRLDDTEGGAWVGFAPVGFDGSADAAVLDLVLLDDAVVDDGRLRAVGGGDTPVLLADVYPGAALAVAAEPGRRTSAGAGQAAQREARGALDRRGGPAGATAVVPLGDTVGLDGTGWEITLADVDRWVGFQVTRMPGSWLLLGAALLALTGLTVSLRAYPRRVWVEARPVPGGSVVLIAGVARHRPWAFAGAFERVTARLCDALDAEVTPAPRTRLLTRSG